MTDLCIYICCASITLLVVVVLLDLLAIPKQLKRIADYLKGKQRGEMVVVVRCIDCADCREKDMFGVVTVLECGRSEMPTQPEGYCYWAERRNEDG